jgi:hypothetical protein
MVRSKIFRAAAGTLALVLLLYASGVAPAAYNLIMDEAGALTRRSTLNFTGAGVTCVDNGGALRTDCTIPGGGTVIVGTGGPNYVETFAGVGSVSMTNAEHGFGHASLLVSCYDNSAPPQLFEPTSITINAATYEVIATFAINMTGYCVVNGGAGTGCAPYTVASTNAAFQAASTTADIALFTLPQYGKVQGVTIKHSAQFTDGAGAMTDVSVSVGNAVAPYTQYAAASSIGEVTAVADTTFYDTVGFKSTTMAAAGGPVSAHFIATGRNFGDGAGNTFLTGGSVTVWVCSLRVQ